MIFGNSGQYGQHDIDNDNSGMIKLYLVFIWFPDIFIPVSAFKLEVDLWQGIGPVKSDLLAYLGQNNLGL